MNNNDKIITVTRPLLPDLAEYNQLLQDIWNRKWITNMGHYHEELEKRLAEYLGVEYISLFTNGTLPLITALQALGITEGENVIHLRTLRRVNGVALCLIDHYFADLTLWPTLQRFDSGSLHDFLREQTGIALRRSQTRISARRAQAKECQRLEIPNMSPLLCVRTLNHRDGESSPAEYSVSLTRADMIEFTMEH